MRYLKTYTLYERVSEETKIFESDGNNVREDLTEICYELTDGRFGIKIYDDSDFPGWGHIPGSGMNVPRVERDDKILCIYLLNNTGWTDPLKNKHYHGFSFDEVRDVVLRVVDYLGDRYKGCSVLSVDEHERSSINKKDIVSHYWTSNLSNIIIIYR